MTASNIVSCPQIGSSRNRMVYRRELTFLFWGAFELSQKKKSVPRTLQYVSCSLAHTPSNGTKGPCGAHCKTEKKTPGEWERKETKRASSEAIGVSAVVVNARLVARVYCCAPGWFDVRVAAQHIVNDSYTFEPNRQDRGGRRAACVVHRRGSTLHNVDVGKMRMIREVEGIAYSIRGRIHLSQ